MHLCWKWALINASLCHGTQRFTAADAPAETRVDAEQHGEATRGAEEAVIRGPEGL